jgi:hypothetical protein
VNYRNIHVIAVVGISVSYGLFRCDELNNWSADVILFESIVPALIAAFPTLIIEFIKFAVQRGKYDYTNSLNTFFYVFYTCALLMALGSINGKKQKSEYKPDEPTFKREVLDNTNDTILKAGDYRLELLNTNNLYENYRDHFTIKFPENFEVDYGTGKDSEVRATNSNFGYVIAVTVAPTGTEKFFDGNSNKNFVSDTMVAMFFDLMSENEYRKKLVQSHEERGLSDVAITEVRLTNYNKRKYIEVKYFANAILDNVKHPVRMIGYTTYYNHHVYQFYFRSYENQFNEEWKATIRNTMSTVLVDEKIRDYR